MTAKRHARRLPAAAAMLVLPAALIGCQSSGPHHAGDIDSIRWNPTPAMHTLAERDSDRLNYHAHTRDTNLQPSPRISIRSSSWTARRACTRA